MCVSRVCRIRYTSYVQTFKSPCAAAATDIGDIRSSGCTNGATHGIPIKRVKNEKYTSAVWTLSKRIILYNVGGSSFIILLYGYVYNNTRTAVLVLHFCVLVQCQQQQQTNDGDGCVYEYRCRFCILLLLYYVYTHHAVVDFGYRIRTLTILIQ